MWRSLGVGAFVVFSAVAFGCTSPRDGFADNNAVAPSDRGVIGDPTLPTESEPTDASSSSEECQRMDILFVIDDSGSMKEEQANLAANVPKFFEKIDTFKTKSGAKLDWRVAVTTTGRTVNYKVKPPFLGDVPISDKGDDGAFRQPATCSMQRRWIERADPSAQTRFECLAQPGTGGASLEMPLGAVKMAFNERVADGTNAGFLREDALLAVVILTDEDDCSRFDADFTIDPMKSTCSTMENVRPVAEFKTMLDNVAKGEGRWATAVMAGPQQCTSSFGDAVEASRLKEFVGLAGKNGTFSSICDGDLSGALVKALDTFDAACKVLPKPKVN